MKKFFWPKFTEICQSKTFPHQQLGKTGMFTTISCAYDGGAAKIPCFWPVLPVEKSCKRLLIFSKNSVKMVPRCKKVVDKCILVLKSG